MPCLACPLTRRVLSPFPPPQTDTTDTVYSLHGSVLKFDDLASIQPYLDQLEAVSDLQEVRFGGNTLGVEACKGVADALATKKNLRVSSQHLVRTALTVLLTAEGGADRGLLRHLHRPADQRDSGLASVPVHVDALARQPRLARPVRQRVRRPLC